MKFFAFWYEQRSNHADDAVLRRWKLGRLVRRRDAGASTDIAAYQYIGPGAPVALAYQNGVRLTHIAQDGTNGNVLDGRDTLGRITNHRWERDTAGTALLGNGSLILGFEHRDAAGNSLHDAEGNKLIEYKTHHPERSQMYRYDSAGRLASPGANDPGVDERAFQIGTFTDSSRSSMAGGVEQWQDWNLDGANNWVGVLDSVTGYEDRGHNAFNEIDAIGSHSLATIAHDSNGNMIADGDYLRDFGWDAFGRLREVRYNGFLVARYHYDADNRRMTRTVSNGGIASDASLNGTTHFYYSGWRVMEERTVNGSLEPVSRQYTWGNYLDEVWTIDDRSGGTTVADLNNGTGGERHFALANTLYSVHGLADEEGNLVEAYEYDAYGRHTVRRPGASATEVAFDATDDVVAGGASAFGNPFGYTGQRFDAEAGLMYYKNRYYSPELGRFMSRDPLGAEASFTMDSGSFSAYVNSNPAKFLDPHGLCQFERYFEECRCAAMRRRFFRYHNAKNRLADDTQQNRSCYERANLRLASCSSGCVAVDPQNIIDSSRSFLCDKARDRALEEAGAHAGGRSRSVGRGAGRAAAQRGLGIMAAPLYGECGYDCWVERQEILDSCLSRADERLFNSSIGGIIDRVRYRYNQEVQSCRDSYCPSGLGTAITSQRHRAAFDDRGVSFCEGL